MLLFGINFNLYSLLLMKKFNSVFKSTELLFYLGLFVFIMSVYRHGKKHDRTDSEIEQKFSISLNSQKSSSHILRMRNILSQTRWFRVVLSLLLLSAIHVHAVDYNGILPLPKSIVMPAKQGTYALQYNKHLRKTG